MHSKVLKRSFVNKCVIFCFASFVSPLTYTNVNTIEVPHTSTKFGRFVLIQKAIQAMIIV